EKNEFVQACFQKGVRQNNGGDDQRLLQLKRFFASNGMGVIGHQPRCIPQPKSKSMPRRDPRHRYAILPHDQSDVRSYSLRTNRWHLFHSDKRSAANLDFIRKSVAFSPTKSQTRSAEKEI